MIEEDSELIIISNVSIEKEKLVMWRTFFILYIFFLECVKDLQDNRDLQDKRF